MIPDPNAPCVAPDPVKVRTTMRPWEEIKVPPGEVAVLKQQGILYDGPPVTEADFDEHNHPKPGDKPAPKASAGKTKEG